MIFILAGIWATFLLILCWILAGKAVISARIKGKNLIHSDESYSVSIFGESSSACFGDLSDPTFENYAIYDEYY